MTADYLSGGFRSLILRGLAALLAIASLPVQLVLLAISAVTFRSNPVFVDTRVGLRGRVIPVHKIRSLPRDCPIDLDKEQVRSLTPGRFGTFVRRTHLDELLQLWDVVLGRMALIGPRPAAVWQAAQFDADFSRCRTSVLPGLTGLWQVTVASRNGIADDESYDRLYVAYASPRLDMWVLWQTWKKICLGRSAAHAPSWIVAASIDELSPVDRPESTLATG